MQYNLSYRHHKPVDLEHDELTGCGSGSSSTDWAHLSACSSIALMGNVPQQVGQLTRKQSSPDEDVDGAAAVLFPLPELKLGLFSGTANRPLYQHIVEDLQISPSGKRCRVIRAYPNPDSSWYLLKVKSSSGPMPGMCLTSLPSLKNVFRMWTNKPAV